MSNPRPPEPPKEEEVYEAPSGGLSHHRRVDWTIRGMSLSADASGAGGGTSDVPVYERTLRAVSLRPVRRANVRFRG